MKRMLSLLIINFCLNSYQGNLPEPYRSINPLPSYFWRSWFDISDKQGLNYFITKIKPKVIIELGSWFGESAIFQATLLPENGTLYAIDNWIAQADIEAHIHIMKRNGDNELANKVPELYHQFLSNVINAGQAHKIIPVRMKTLEAAKALDIKADLIYVDASHDEESVYQDIINWYDKLNEDGIMCGDDWIYADPITNIPGVQLGVKKAAKQLGLDIKTHGTFWYFDPKQ